MKRSMRRDFQYLSVSTIILSMFFIGGFWILYEFRNLQQESERIRAKYMSEYQDQLRYQVDRVVAEIKYEQSYTEQKLRKYIKERTYEAWGIVRSIVDGSAGLTDKTVLEKVVKDSLRDIRFSNGNGYYFAFDMDGTVELNGVQPGLEGKQIGAIQNGQGRFVVADMLKIARSAGEGFYQYSWSKPGRSDQEYPKISFVKYVKELDWVIGAGEYLDSYTSELQEDIVNRVEQIRFGREKKDYVFIATLEGVGRSFPATGRNMLEAKDANGVYIVRELIKKAKSGGGFVEYIMPSLEGVQSKPKLSYAAPVHEWSWYVGAGVYIDEIDTTIAEHRMMFRKKVVQQIKIILAVIGFMLLVHFVIAHFISRKIWRQIDMFSQFFRKASTESVSMDSNILDYKEFREISHQANKMLDDRNTFLQEIRLSRDEWVNTFNAIGDCIILLDDTGRVKLANEAALNLHGMEAEKMIDLPISELCSYDNPVNDTLRDRLSHTAEIENEKLQRTFLASSFPFLSAQGKMSRIIYIAHDITELKKLEKQLGQAQKMEALGTLAGGIAHDFNNILAAILGYTELAQKMGKLEGPAADYLERVLKAGGRAKELVKQILSFSRQAEMEKTSLEVGPIVKETLKLLRSSLPTTITIEQHIEPDSGFIRADPTRVHQIVMNICTNSFHAMEQTGGTLVVRLQRTSGDDGESADRCLELSISDDGPGIEPAIKDRIFDPFFTTKDVGRGTGLGLAIVDGIVKDSGGTIRCSSRLGVGTTFSIRWPVLDQKSAPEPESAGKQFFGTERILYVDDERELSEMGQAMLEQLGYLVKVCSDSLEALDLVTENPDGFDLVITDQTMPGMAGMELARRILQIRPDLPIIICTGYSSIVSAEKARAVGVRGFAMKPFVWKDIGREIRRLLDT